MILREHLVCKDPELGATVEELADYFAELVKQGWGSAKVESFDPDTQAWEGVTTTTLEYDPELGDKWIRIYTDIP